MNEFVTISHEPMNICAVLINEDAQETPQDSCSVVKVVRDDSVDEKPSKTPAVDSNTPDPASYTCEICSKRFLQRRYMTAHRLRHPEYRKIAQKLREEKLRILKAKKDQHYACIYCEKQFSSSSTVNRHMKIHTNEKTPTKDFICDVCKKIFAHKRDIRVHLRVHTGERPFKCHICEKRFTQLASLRYHVTGHSDTRPFPCQLCEKQFLRRISLERHIRIHFGDRPFVCDVCGKAFTQDRHLIVHKRTVHTERKKVKRRRRKL